MLGSRIWQSAVDLHGYITIVIFVSDAASTMYGTEIFYTLSRTRSSRKGGVNQERS